MNELAEKRVTVSGGEVAEGRGHGWFGRGSWNLVRGVWILSKF